MSNQEQEHAEKINCEEHAESVKNQIIESEAAPDLTYALESDGPSPEEQKKNHQRSKSALHKASVKMFDKLAAVHGAEKAKHIIAQETDRHIRKNIFKQSIIQQSIRQEIYNPNSSLYVQEDLEESEENNG